MLGPAAPRSWWSVPGTLAGASHSPQPAGTEAVDHGHPGQGQPRAASRGPPAAARRPAPDAPLNVVGRRVHRALGPAPGRSGSSPPSRCGHRVTASPALRTASMAADSTRRAWRNGWRNSARSFGPGAPQRVNTVPHARKKSHVRRLRCFQDVPGRRLGESSACCDRCLGGGAPAGRA